MSTKSRVLYLFDVDGTLTKPRQKMSPGTSRVLAALKTQAFVGLVGGSDLPKVLEQVGASDGDTSALAAFDYVFAENGLDAYKEGRRLATQNIVNHCGEDLLQELINFALDYMSKIKLPRKRGTFIEFRNGMINFSPIGRSCTQKERDEFVEFDSKHGIRTKFVAALREKFPEDVGLVFAIGGQISIDVFPKGWDKTYCLRFLENENFDAIHFFGDKVTEGGNDHAIYVHPATVGHAVENPEDTVSQLCDMLPVLRDAINVGCS